VAEKLTDPSKPAHEIIKWEDGDAIRNDGVRLQAANKNPWYVLATIYGEQEAPWGEGQAKNRRVWNGWFCSELSDEERADRATKAGLDEGELAPLTASERTEIEERFAERMKSAGVENPKMPDPAQNIDFSRVIFLDILSFQNFIFEKTCIFSGAYFANGASFKNTVFVIGGLFDRAVFKGGVNFTFSTFEDDADFRGAKFSNMSEFELAIFRGITDFHGARFGMGVFFGGTTFEGSVDFSTSKFTGGLLSQDVKYNGGADFSDTEFYEEAYFRSAEFKSITKFNNARFLTHVPEFHAAELYDNTVFPASSNQIRNWPPLRGSVQLEGRDVIKHPEDPSGRISTVESNEPVDVMPAEDQKRAYNRLRLFMNKSLQIDEEQFFHRQEMRCKTKLANKWHSKLLYRLYSGLSDYGNSVWRPVGFLVLVMLFGFVANLWISGNLATLLPHGDAGMGWSFGLLGEDDPWAKPRQAAGWSISNTLPFLGFGKLYYGDLAWPLEVAGGVQTLLGYVLLFFFGLGLRNRFRLR